MLKKLEGLTPEQKLLTVAKEIEHSVNDESGYLRYKRFGLEVKPGVVICTPAWLLDQLGYLDIPDCKLEESQRQEKAELLKLCAAGALCCWSDRIKSFADLSELRDELKRWEW